MNPLKQLFLPVGGVLALAACSQQATPAPLAQQPSAQACLYTSAFTPASYTTGFGNAANPMSGLYTWFGTEFDPITPAGQQYNNARVVYRRYSWDSFYNFTTGQYDFSWLNTVIGWARNRGQKLAFRVQPMGDKLEPDPANRSYLPTHVEPYSTRVTYPQTGTPQVDVVVPNWNDPTFLQLYREFYQKLREHLIQTNQAKDIAFVDIGTYGFWGEWHLWTGTPAVLPSATPQTQQQLVDLVTDNLLDLGFPLVMMSDAKEVLPYALAKSDKIGWRRDSLGWDHFSGGLNSSYSSTFIETVLKTRYKTAPVVAEFAQVLSDPGRDRPNFFGRALADVQAYHISTVSNGNTTLNWTDLTSSEQAQVHQIHKTAGLWPSLKNVSTSVDCLNQLNLTLNLQNTGTTPAYESWKTQYQLLNSKNVLVASGTAALDLTSLQPGSTQAYLNGFALPTTLASGKYKLYLTVRDGRQIFPVPMVLGGPAADSSGKQLLGTLSLTRTTR